MPPLTLSLLCAWLCALHCLPKQFRQLSFLFCILVWHTHKNHTKYLDDIHHVATLF